MTLSLPVSKVHPWQTRYSWHTSSSKQATYQLGMLASVSSPQPCTPTTVISSISIIEQESRKGKAKAHLGGVDVHDAHLASGSEATGLLSDERHGRALVEEAQLAVLVLLVPGVAVDATVQKRSVEVTDERTDVPRLQCARPVSRKHGVMGVRIHAW